LLLPLVAVTAWSWDDTGHMVASAVAYERLTPTAKAEANRLLAIGGDSKTQDFLGASAWADDIRRSRPNTGPWHYIDYHFRSDGQPTSNQPDSQNVENAIKVFTGVLADRTQPDAQRADALRFLMHFVEDSHQPLHCVSRDSDEYPQGDRGGNEFSIVAPDGLSPVPHNLHALWDEGAGLFPHYRRPLSADSETAIYALADRLAAQYGAHEAKMADDLNEHDWTQEGLKLAKNKVYGLTEGATPDPSYLAMVQAVAGQRIVLAGMRLAHLLNKLLG